VSNDKCREAAVPQDKVSTHLSAPRFRLQRSTGLTGALHLPSNANGGGSMFSSNAFFPMFGNRFPAWATRGAAGRRSLNNVGSELRSAGGSPRRQDMRNAR